MAGYYPMIETIPAAQDSFLGDYPYEAVETAALRDGTPVLIRPIRPDDAPRLQEGFRRLSPRSIYLRFLEAYKELSDRQAREFSCLDYVNRMALVAEIEEDGESHLIGVARYAMIPGAEEGLAEAAVVVVDEYQGRGLGKLLMRHLVQYARQHGVHTFLATIHVSNAVILHFIRSSGLPMEKKIVEPGVWEVRVRLNQD